MKKIETKLTPFTNEHDKTLVKLCHCCGHLHDTSIEVDRCQLCKKSFLPAKYFEKIHDIHQNFQQLFSKTEDLEEKDLIKGLMVIW